MASTLLPLCVPRSGRVQAVGRLALYAFLGGAAMLTVAPQARAGFEWNPPVRTAPASGALSGVTPPPLTSSDLNAGPRPSVAPVVSQPLSPLAPLPPSEPAGRVSAVPPIDLQPLKSGTASRRDRLVALQSAQGAARSGALSDFVPPAVLAERRAKAVVGVSDAPVPPSSRFAEAVGFGRDIPLALAMRQVIPPSYGFSFAESVDAGQRVSWSGGKPWDQVLDTALRPAGLGASISGNAVHIAPLPVGGARTPMMSEPAQDLASGRPVSARPQAAPRPEALTPLPPAAVAPSASQPRAMKGVDAELLPDPVSVPQVSTGAPVPLTGSAQPSGFPKGLIKASGPMDLPPVSPEPIPQADARAPLPADLSLPRSPDDLGRRAPEPMPVRAIPASFPAKSSGLPVRGFDMDAVQDWSASAGSTLRRVLTDWSQKAGVQLHWSSQFDYPIQANIHMTGTYQKAVETLLDGLRDAKPRPLARLHPNLPAGPAVLILQTQHVIN